VNIIQQAINIVRGNKKSIILQLGIKSPFKYPINISYICSFDVGQNDITKL